MASNRLEALENSALKVARSLVNRSTLKVVTGGISACWNFETDTLFLPNYSLDTPDEDLTEEQVAELRDAFRGTMAHEMSHARNTDAAVVREFQAKWKAAGLPVTRLHALWHIFEDPFVETIWPVEFPGSRKFIKASRQFVIRETGGAGPCWPGYIGKHGKPMGLFGAFLQAVLRLYAGCVTRDEISPEVLTLIDAVQDILDDFDPMAGTQHNGDLTLRVWERLVALIPQSEQDEDPDLNEPGGMRASDDEPGGLDTGSGSDNADGDEEGDEEGEGEGAGGADCDNDGDGEGGTPGAGGDEDGDDDADNGADNGEDSDAGDDDGRTGKGGGRENKRGGNDKGKHGDDNRGVGELAAKAINGEWDEIPDAGELLAGKFVGERDPMRAPYTVNPAVKDKWVTFDAERRKEGAEMLKHLRGCVGTEASFLSARLRRAIVSQRRDLWVGAMEDGPELDVDSLPYLAANLDSQRIYSQRFGKPAEDTFVCVMVDCSGSMGSSESRVYCPTHGYVNQKGDKCSRKDWDGRRCNQPLTRKVQSKAGYAAMTATVLHDALRQVKVEHAVLGYTTGYRGSGYAERCRELGTDENPIEAHGYRRWTREGTIITYEFVKAPGLSDRGDALPFITGRNANSDGCSIMEAAKYAAKHGRNHGRVILLVVADGLPAGHGEQAQEYAHLTRSVEQIAQAGIEVYGIGVGIHDPEQFAAFYPDNPGGGGRAGTGNVLIPSGEGLSRSVMGSLLGLMTRNNGRRR